jgi:hypothetical protein
MSHPLAGPGMSESQHPRLRAYVPGDEDAIQQMFQDVFGRARTPEEWRWRFLEGPDGPAAIHVLEESGRLVGHIAHVPFRAWVDGRRLRLGHGGDTMVVAASRGRGGMKALVEGFLAADHGFDLRLNFPTDQAAGLMQRYGGGRLLGRIPKWVRLLDRPRQLAWPARLLPGRALRAYAAVASRPLPRLAVEPLRELGPAVDELARASAGFARCIRIRDAAYLRWRWLEQPGAAWQLTAARDSAGALRGLAVWGTKEDEVHGRRGLVVDLLAADAESTRALLLAASRALREQGCDRVVCDCADPRPWVRRAFLRAGFLPAGGDINVVCGSLSAGTGPVPERLDAWYLTRGDTDLA